eukprot:170830_1
MDVFQREREQSISRSYEGSDIVYENLLGDLLHIEQDTAHSKKFGTAGNHLLHGSLTTNHITNKTIDISSDIEDIFDDDLFDLNKEEMEKHSNYLLTDAEDLEDEDWLDSAEGADPTTLPLKPARIDVFDSILMDLDEKTKEMEQKKNKENEQNMKKNSKTKKRKKKKKKRKGKMKENVNLFKQTHKDKKMLNIECGANIELNPWILRKWEFTDKHKRRSLRTLLSTLNGEILWQEITEDDDHGWEIVKRKDIIYDKDCYRVLFHALSVFHCDKSIARGDTMERQIICAWVYNALQNAYNAMVAKK